MAIARSVTSALLPIMAVVFIGFLIIGMALPVLPLHVHQGLGCEFRSIVITDSV